MSGPHVCTCGHPADQHTGLRTECGRCACGTYARDHRVTVWPPPSQGEQTSVFDTPDDGPGSAILGDVGGDA